MALKTKNIIFTIIKVAILTLIIFWIIYFVSNLFKNTNTDSTNEEKTNNEIFTKEVNTTDNKNKQNFENIKLENISAIWVAISTNVWMKFQSSQDTKNINNDLGTSENNYINMWNISVDEIITNNDSSINRILEKNLTFLQEYRSFIKMDYNLAFKNSPDKAYTLDNLVKQLGFRFRTSVLNVKNLLTQQEWLKSEYLANKRDLNNIKQKIEKDYNSVDIEELKEDLTNYYALKSRETKLTTYLVFIWNMIKNHNVMNDYNKIVLDTLINNKDVISKNSFVVLPDSGNKVLNDLDLIMTEKEYKTEVLQKKEE